MDQTIEQGYDYAVLRCKSTQISEQLQEKFSYRYPYEAWQNIPGKVSVSELKKAAMEEDVRELFEEPEIIPYIPTFLREERKGSAAERGTAYHRVMECMDLSEIHHSDQVFTRKKYRFHFMKNKIVLK